MFRPSSIAVFAVSISFAACGNSTGATATGDGDASTGDLQLSGTDASDTASDSADVSADATTTACAPTYTGTIPGATLDLSKTPCAFSISAAKGVFNLGYKLNVAASEKFAFGSNLGSCPPQESSIHGGIATFEQLDGPNSQRWCLCDTGLCAATKPPFTASTPGSYDVPFTWDGNNWYGPSDTGNKPGPAFPPGAYVFSVTVSGDHQKPDGATKTLTAVAKLPITLTP